MFHTLYIVNYKMHDFSQIYCLILHYAITLLLLWNKKKILTHITTHLVYRFVLEMLEHLHANFMSARLSLTSHKMTSDPPRNLETFFPS